MVLSFAEAWVFVGAPLFSLITGRLACVGGGVLWLSEQPLWWLDRVTVWQLRGAGGQRAATNSVGDNFLPLSTILFPRAVLP